MDPPPLPTIAQGDQGAVPLAVAGGQGANQANKAAAEIEKLLRDYPTPFLLGNESSIRRPSIEANNFEIHPSIINLIHKTVQFSGMPNENPNAHISSFLEIYDTFKIVGESNDAVRLRLLPFSLKERAK